MADQVRITQKIDRIDQDQQYTTIHFPVNSCIGTLRIATANWTKLDRPVAGEHIVFEISVKEYKK